jgi:hypothetical protein
MARRGSSAEPSVRATAPAFPCSFNLHVNTSAQDAHDASQWDYGPVPGSEVVTLSVVCAS